MKKLTEYINEGLFKNVGIGSETTFGSFFKQFNYEEVYNLNNLRKFNKLQNTGAYYFETDKKGQTLINIKKNQTQIFPDKGSRLEVPSYIKINKLYFDASDCNLVLKSVNCNDWVEFFPKKIVPGNVCAVLNFNNCNINDKELKQITEQIPSLRKIHIMDCENIKQSEVKLYPAHSTHKDAQFYINRIMLQYDNNKNLQSLSFDAPQVQDLYLNIWNCDKFNSLKGSKFSAKNFQIDFQNSKLGNDLSKILYDDISNDRNEFLNHPFIKEFLKLIKNCNKTKLYFFAPEELPLTKCMTKKFDEYNFEAILYRYGLY